MGLGKQIKKPAGSSPRFTLKYREMRADAFATPAARASWRNELVTATTAAAATAASTVEATAAAGTTAKAGLPARREPASVAATGYAAERPWPAGVATLATGKAAGTTVIASIWCATAEPVSSAIAAVSAAVKIGTAVIEGTAVIPISAASVEDATMAPIKAPSAPTPAEPEAPADSEAEAPRKVGTRSPPRVKARPDANGIAERVIRIVDRDVDGLRVSRLNLNVRALIRDHLLLGGTQMTGGLRFMAHILDRVHDGCSLVGVGVAKFGGPRQILIHIGEDGRELRQGLHAGIPRLLVHRVAKFLAFEIGILLDKALSFNDLRGVGAGGQDLRHESVRVQSDGRDQLLKLLGRQLRGSRALLWCRGGLGLVAARTGVLRSVNRPVLLRILKWRGLHGRTGNCDREGAGQCARCAAS